MVSMGLWLILLPAFLGRQDPFQDLEKKKTEPRSPAPAVDPGFFDDNFTFKWELYSQFSYARPEPRDGETFAENTYSRQSVGIEFLKKFSTETATVASLDFQGRAVRRDHFIETINDMEGERREGWFFEYHNFYADLYNVFDLFLSDAGRGENIGRFNLRAGHYLSLIHI